VERTIDNEHGEELKVRSFSGLNPSGFARVDFGLHVLPERCRAGRQEVTAWQLAYTRQCESRRFKLALRGSGDSRHVYAVVAISQSRAGYVQAGDDRKVGSRRRCARLEATGL
jgi:hypothetical protein